MRKEHITTCVLNPARPQQARSRSSDDAVIEDKEQAENRSLFDMLNAKADESDPDTTVESKKRRVIARKNAAVEDGWYACNICGGQLSKSQLSTQLRLSISLGCSWCLAAYSR